MTLLYSRFYLRFPIFYDFLMKRPLFDVDTACSCAFYAFSWSQNKKKIFMWIFSCISHMCVRHRLNIRLHMNPLCGIMIYAEFMNFLCLSTSIMRLLSDFYSQYEEYVQSSSIQTLCLTSKFMPELKSSHKHQRWRQTVMMMRSTVL